MTQETAPEQLTPDDARALLDSVPAKPRRQLELRDHVSVIVTVISAYAAGVMATTGLGWWAIAPALVAVIVSHQWIAKRQKRVNEPRMWASQTVTTVFTVWLALPIWRSVVHDQVLEQPGPWVMGALAPVLWLIYYVILLVRR